MRPSVVSAEALRCRLFDLRVAASTAKCDDRDRSVYTPASKPKQSTRNSHALTSLQRLPVDLNRRSPIHGWTTGLTAVHPLRIDFAKVMDARVKPGMTAKWIKSTGYPLGRTIELPPISCQRPTRWLHAGTRRTPRHACNIRRIRTPTERIEPYTRPRPLLRAAVAEDRRHQVERLAATSSAVIGLPGVPATA